LQRAALSDKARAALAKWCATAARYRLRSGRLDEVFGLERLSSAWFTAQLRSITQMNRARILGDNGYFNFRSHHQREVHHLLFWQQAASIFGHRLRN